MLDMDGTLYLGEKAFDFTGELLSRIKIRGKRYLLMTNNSAKSAAEYVKKLKKLGITVTEEEVITSAQATAYYLKLHHRGARLYVCGTHSLKEELRKEGFEVTEELDKVDCIIVGNDIELTFQKLIDVCRLLCARNLPYIATHPDLICPTEFGNVPDCGSICDMIYNATGRRPLIIGKPETLLPELALKRVGCRKEDAVLVGDRLYTDIRSGLKAGITSVLVLSGETTKEMLKSSEDIPHIVLESCRELIPFI